MSTISRSPKVPLSPASPPETGLKRKRESGSESKLPPSPEYMSVATKSYVSSYGQSQNLDETASRSSPRSPASSASYNNNPTQRTSQPYYTPASSISGIPGLGMTEELDLHRDKRQKMESREGNDDAMEVDSSISPTNHERNAEMKKEESATPTVVLEGQEQDRNRGTLDQPQTDLDEPFLLCRSRVEPSIPDPNQHLLGIYGLSPLLQTVARTDPITGEKINKLRKSYEGQVKTFMLPGRNRPVACEKNEEADEPGSLRKVVGSSWRGLETDAEWEKRNGRATIQVTDNFRDKLKKAMQMQQGKVRDIQKWEEALGIEKGKPHPHPPVVGYAPPQKLSNGMARPQPPVVPDFKRTTRGKKRSYGDDSFAGYNGFGDGFSDPEDAGANDYGSDDGGSRRKRRKASPGF